MINRSLSRRISKLEQLLPTALEQREERRIQLEQRLPSIARLHATEVAAMVLAGEPKLGEPLSEAWVRTLAHYGVGECVHELWARTHARLPPTGAWARILDPNLNIGKHPLKAAENLYPMIIKGPSEVASFTEIFERAPTWLLKFTLIQLDARSLNFDLPDLSAATAWGSIGLQDARRWPLLPRGTMTAGDPVSERQDDLPSVEECMLIPFCKWQVDPLCPFFDPTFPGLKNK
jgi:hypothetical protein